jgi:tellurite resistance protein
MNTPATPHHTPSKTTRAIALLEYLAPAWFALVMGWCGLSLAWLRATDLFGDTALGLGLVGGLFSAVLFVLLCIACVIRLNAHPHAVAADLRHPVRHAFMATLPVSILLLANLGIHLFWGTSSTLNTLLTFVWCVGSMLEIAATVWVLSRWLNSAENGGFQLENWATAQFGVGLFFWPILQTMLFVRVAQAGPLPARMAPTWFIALVPPSLIGLSLLQLNAPVAVVWAVWGIGAFILALVLTKIHSICEHAFGMPYWATSFPSAAFTTFTLRMSQERGGAWLELPATVMLALTSLLILGLTLQTWRGLRHGHLLVPEK